jgi:hypothetical protein
VGIGGTDEWDALDCEVVGVDVVEDSHTIFRQSQILLPRRIERLRGAMMGFPQSLPYACHLESLSSLSYHRDVSQASQSRRVAHVASDTVHET